MDAMETLDRFFEGEFQRFWTQGCYTKTLDEDWERRRAQAPLKKEIPRCSHGKTKLTCHECYFKESK